MQSQTKNHLKSNRGDANVSKMTIIAIAFVVGAILLVLTTSAFRNPINRWFDKVQAGWFASENGMYEADNPFVGYQKNENGTYQNVMYYRWEPSMNRYIVVANPETLQTGEYPSGVAVWYYDANWNYMSSGKSINPYKPTPLSIGSDGTAIVVNGSTFTAKTP